MKINVFTIYQSSKFQIFAKANSYFPDSLVLSNLRLETKGCWCETAHELRAEVSSLQ